MRPSGAGARVAETLALDAQQPLLDRRAPVATVAPEGDGRDATQPALLVDPPGRHAEHRGDLLGREKRARLESGHDPFLERDGAGVARRDDNHRATTRRPPNDHQTPTRGEAALALKDLQIDGFARSVSRTRAGPGRLRRPSRYARPSRGERPPAGLSAAPRGPRRGPPQRAEPAPSCAPDRAGGPPSVHRGSRNLHPMTIELGRYHAKPRSDSPRPQQARAVSPRPLACTTMRRTGPGSRWPARG